MKKLMTVT